MARAAAGGKKKSKFSSRAEWLLSFVKRFNPKEERDAKVTVLDFEKPLAELDKRIREVRDVASENGVDVSEQVKELERRAVQLRIETYSRLTPPQRLNVARHPNRPTFLDIVMNITDKWVELHGDRAGFDDPAMVCGIGSMNGESFMFIGQQKGRNTKENIHRNFGMPTPNGYRKALRFMKHADKFGMPIVTFVDTPGAYAGKTAEELGQGEAIALNLREMFGLSVPLISMVIGEGGSGGALAIGCANKSLIMENAVYYVASPEACAAILWKSRDKAAEATKALRITSDDMVQLGIFDEVVPEPPGAAHTDPMAAFPLIRKSLLDSWEELRGMSPGHVRAQRYAKFRDIGHFVDRAPNNPALAASSPDARARFDAALGVPANTQVPAQPPGLLDGTLALANAMNSVSLEDDDDLGEVGSAEEVLQELKQ